MKYLSLKSFLIFALFLYAFSSQAFASEVTGTLSSSEGSSTTAQPNNTGGSPAPDSSSGGNTATPSNGTVAGTVTGGSSDSPDQDGGSQGNGGEVMGESTETTAHVKSPSATTASLSSPKAQRSTTISSQTSTRASAPTAIAQDQDQQANTSEDSLVFTDITPLTTDSSYVPEAQTATAFGAFREFSAANWFWIILLALLLIAVVGYIYNHEREVRGTKLGI